MPKQVIDITTPSEEEQEEFPAVLATTPVKKPSSKRKKPTKAKKKEGEIIVENRGGVELKKKKKEKERIRICFTLPSFAIKLPIFILIFIIILGGAFLYLTLQAKAEIKIKPVTEPIKIEDEIQVVSSLQQIDFEKKIIPGQVIEKEMEKWATFKATGTGTEQSGASGVIFVYNNINPPTPLNLKEATRFISSKDGKIYKAKNKISLPPATFVNGKLTPSATEVQVIAQQEGEDYNIAPASFSVPGLAGTTLYYSIWAESKEKIEGGSQKEIQEVTEQDLEIAHSTIADNLKEELRVVLKEQVPPGFSLNQEAISFNEPEVSCSQEATAKATEFNCYTKIKATAVIFKETDLRLMAQNFIESKISSTKKLQEQSLLTSLRSKGGITESGNIVLSLKIEANLYNNINVQGLEANFAGKSKDEMNGLLRSVYPQIEKIDVKLWPFWIKKAPKNLNKIEADIIF